MKNIKKIVALVLAMVLVAGLSVAGTVAYLTDRDAKTNVFTVGNVDISLNEAFGQGAALIPGVEITAANKTWNVFDSLGEDQNVYQETIDGVFFTTLHSAVQQSADQRRDHSALSVQSVSRRADRHRPRG